MIFSSMVKNFLSFSSVTNDEPTNGVKILRRKDPPVDLHADLPSLSSVTVVQRLKLILDKLESSQLDTVPPEVLQKNIQYAIQFIQDGEKDRFERTFSILYFLYPLTNTKIHSVPVLNWYFGKISHAYLQFNHRPCFLSQ